jgi:hypothetical protein
VRAKDTYGSIAAWCAALVFLVPNLFAQAAGSGHIGWPQDWSEHHIIFSLDGLAAHPESVNNEVRVQHQLMQRFAPPNSDFFRGLDIGADFSTNLAHRDWNVSLGRGRVAADMFPAKYSFDPSQPPSCTADYVVFGLNTPGANGGQANLVAFNNLYSGTNPTGYCGTAPTVMFAYNVSTETGGRVITSPALSLDGTKIAFLETYGTTTVFHVLTWTAGQGTITSAAVPVMTSLTLSTASGNTNSPPWIDYGNDVAYVGSNNGFVYKINNVFTGTPSLAGSPWPVSIGTVELTAPVLDGQRKLLMVGSKNGNLYQISTTTGGVSTLVVGAHGGTSPGIVAPPIVDVTNDTTFVVSANDGTSAVLVQVNTSTLRQLEKARIGLGSAGKTAMTILEPAFSNNYFSNPSTGTVNLCGTASNNTNPWRYSFGFTGIYMNTVPASSAQLLTSTTAACTGWTEFYNPNIGGGTDYFFFGLSASCVGASGCVVEINNSGMIMAAIPGGPSGIVVDNYSTEAQASSIYFTAQAAETAYKLTQNGLK